MNRIQVQDFVVRGVVFLVAAIVVMLLTGSWVVATLAAAGGLLSFVVAMTVMKDKQPSSGKGRSRAVKDNPVLAAALLAIAVAAIVAVFLWRVTS